MILYLIILSIALVLCFLFTEFIQLVKNYIPINNNISNLLILLFCLIILSISILIYKKNKHVKINNTFIVIEHVFLYGIIFVVYNHFDSFYSLYQTSVFNRLFILLLELGILYFIPKLLKSNCIQEYYTKKNFIFLIIIASYTAFSIFGNKLFFENDVFPQSIFMFFICVIWILPFLLFVLWLYEYLSQKTNKHFRLNNSIDHKVGYKIFFILVIIWIGYLIALNPANMSTDSMGMWGEATSGEKIGYLNFPSIVIIFNRFLYYIIPSPTFVALVQIIFAAIIISIIFYEMYKYGVPLKFLYIYVICFAINPSNGIMMSTLWSNVPYSLFMLILEYCIFKLIQTKKRWIYAILIGLILPIVYSTRPTGFFPFIVTIICLLCAIFIYFKKRKTILYSLIVSILIASSCTFLIQKPLYSYMTIQDEKKDQEIQVTVWMQLIDGLNSVIYFDGQLPINAEKFMLSLATKEEWKEIYNLYTIDYAKYPEKLLQLPKTKELTKQLTKYYFDTLKTEPLILIQNRLSNSELVWNSIQPINAENERYALTTTNELMIKPNVLNINRKSNILTSSLMLVYYGIIAIAPLDIIIFRSGLYIVLILLFFIYLFNNKQQKFIVCFIPMIADGIALLLSMNFPSFRVVWYIPFIFTLLVPLILAYISTKSDN